MDHGSAFQETQTIQEATRVYGFVKILRNKCQSSPEPSLEAAIALRDVMVMMATDAYPSCENALLDILLPLEGRQQPMSEFRS